jgi:hypothetical protein
MHQKERKQGFGGTRSSRYNVDEPEHRPIDGVRDLQTAARSRLPHREGYDLSIQLDFDKSLNILYGEFSLTLELSQK